MIKGTYIFYEDGLEVARSNNVITKFGKRFITNFLAGRADFFSKDLAYGIDSTAATENDTRLGFEFYRSPVEFGSTEIVTDAGVTSYSVIYKSTIPQDVSGEINEIGLYPAKQNSFNNFSSRFIGSFDNQLDWTDSSGNSPDYITSNAKVGVNLLDMQSSDGASKEFFSVVPATDLSGYSSSDTIRFAYYKYDSNLSSIDINFYSSDSDYYTLTITPTSGIGYKITDDITMDNVFNNFTGSPDKSSINKIGIVISPSSGLTSIGANSIRINDEDTFDPAFGIVSRSALSTPLIKVPGRQVDVEYRLDLAF